MALFTLDSVDNHTVFKSTRDGAKGAKGTIKDKPMSFVYSQKHPFKLPKKTDLPSFVFENGKVDSRILAAIKSSVRGRVAEGTCHKDKKGVLVFNVTKGRKEAEPALWNARAKAPAVSCREIGQLLDDGYWFGVYPKNPKNSSSPLVQMMFPKALKPTVHEQLLQVFELIKQGKSPLKHVEPKKK